MFNFNPFYELTFNFNTKIVYSLSLYLLNQA